MWIVLPTKDCKCATCEKTREVIGDDGQLRPGSTFEIATGPRFLINVPERDWSKPPCVACGSPDHVDCGQQ